MPIPCEACGSPVHERSVRCPHCGGFTGVPVDPIAVAAVEITAMSKDPRDPRDQLPAALIAATPSETEIDVVAHLASGVTRIVGAAIDLVVPRNPDDDPVPRAKARKRKKTESG